MAAARGPQAGPVIVTFTGLYPMIRAVQDLEKAVDKPDMAGPIRGAAKVWGENFKAEGWLAGSGWKPLSEFTRNLREWRGYDPDHPILVQSGGLRAAAVEYPSKFKDGQKSMARSNSRGDANTQLVIRTMSRRATLTISGPKVENNTGGVTSGMGWAGSHEHGLPKRRFWFVSEEVRSQMVEALLESLKPKLDKFA